MKDNKHPKKYKVKIILSNGEEKQLILTKNFNNLTLDIDYTNHPAWNIKGEDKYNVFQEINKFKKKFGEIEF